VGAVAMRNHRVFFVFDKERSALYGSIKEPVDLGRFPVSF